MPSTNPTAEPQSPKPRKPQRSRYRSLTLEQRRQGDLKSAERRRLRRLKKEEVEVELRGELPMMVRPGEWHSGVELELMRDLCQRDFWTFFQYAFGAIRNPKGQKWIEPEVHEPLAAWFQHHVDEWLEWRTLGNGRPKHLAILIHREVGKTTMITEAGQAWLHLRDPEISTYTGAESMRLCKKFLRAIMAVMDGSDKYALWSRFYGNWATSATMWTNEEVRHGARKNTARADPSLGAFAVESSITGAHPDAYFYDDPISYERLSTDTNWLAEVNSQIDSLIPVIQSDGLIVWVGTRYDDDDHFGIGFRDAGVASLSGMPTDSIVTDPEGTIHVYYMAGRDREGRPTTPKVWPEARLRAYQKKNPLRYAAQVMNDPALSEHNPVTREQLDQCWLDSTQVPWSALRFALLCDTAFADGKRIQKKDETVFIVVGFPRNGSGDVYACEAHGSPAWRSEDLAHRLVSKVQQYRRQGKKVFAITDEVTMAGKKGVWPIVVANYFNSANEPMPTFYEFGREGKHKEERLNIAASMVVDGHVRFVRGGPGLDRLVEQMAKIGQYMVNPRTKIDYADAFSDAFQRELYQPMRRPEAQRAPWEEGATAIQVDGLELSRFEDEEYGAAMPRPPIR